MLNTKIFGVKAVVQAIGHAVTMLVILVIHLPIVQTVVPIIVFELKVHQHMQHVKHRSQDTIK